MTKLKETAAETWEQMESEINDFRTFVTLHCMLDSLFCGRLTSSREGNMAATGIKPPSHRFCCWEQIL